MKIKTFFAVSLTTAVLFLLSSNSATAQVIVKEGIKPMSKGEKNCFYIELPAADEKMAAEVWKDLMKDYKGKTKTDRKSKEMFTDNVRIKDMSDNTVDVYARIDKNTLTAWFDLGGAYLASYQHSDRYPAAKKLLNSYYSNFSNELAKADLSSKEDEFKSLEKELKKLEDENKRLNETIDKAKETIAKAEAEIAKNNEMQGSKKNEIENKSTEVNAAKEHLGSLSKKINR